MNKQNTFTKAKELSSKKPIARKTEWLSAIIKAFLRLSILYQAKNPVMFVVYIGSIFTTSLGIAAIFNRQLGNYVFILHISFWLWLTVLFANFSESMAETRGKAQAQNLRKARRELQAKKLFDREKKEYTLISATQLRKGDIVFVEKEDLIPGDGKVIEGVASVNESTITGESAPVIRESGGDRDAVTGGTLVLSDWLIVQITSNPGETFLDTMIALVEGAKRQKTPNEIALNILLAGMTLIFLVVVMTLLPYSIFSVTINEKGSAVSVTVLIALLVCLIPTTIGGLLSAIGIAGMDRLIRHNVIANSGRAVEAAGDVSILLLDKTGTITMGNRQAIAFYPATGILIQDLARAAALSSFSDDTPEGKSIVQLAHDKYQIKITALDVKDAIFIPFTADSRCSSVRLHGNQILKGAVDKMIEHVTTQQGKIDDLLLKKVEEVARSGATPLIIIKDNIMLGVVELKDIIKPGIKQRLAELRIMGIKSIMITGDNPMTAATIANEAGVDDFFAEFTPEKKLNLIRKLQQEGQLIAMVGDGTNDAPALAQTDVAVAMNSGTQAAKEAANMVDLDSDPTKLIEIVKIGKQLLMTRGALTTFSIANDIAKYFAIIPASFASTIPAIGVFNIMHLGTSESAILSAVIFNALIIVCLIPLALKGANYRAMTANRLLLKNSTLYGLGGIIIPFIAIKMIDMLINAPIWV